MRRRDFLIAGARASICLIAFDGFRFPASAAPAGTPPQLPAALDDSLHVIRGYLSTYTPPAGNFPASGAWKATYDMVEYTEPRTKPRGPYGRMVLTRRPASSGIAYDVDYTNMIYEFRTGLKSTLQCSAEPLPRLIEWKTDYEKRVDIASLIGRIPLFGQKGPPPRAATAPPVSLAEQGRHKDGVLEITTSLGARRFKTDRPVLPQWVLIDALRNAKADSSDPVVGAEFDLLHDLTSFRPRQHLRPVAVLDLTLPGGKSFTFHGFLQTGFGTEPTHYWVDPDGRPIFITEGIIASALTNIEPA
jgi:hypothetical protein